MNKLCIFFGRVLISFVVILNYFSGCKNNSLLDGDTNITENEKKSVVSVANWNVQTFFDAVAEGNEYQEFRSNARWSKDKYMVRLQRLCEVISTLNADIFVLEEIENEGVLYDISNQLAGKSWNSVKNWNYGCFSREEDSCIGCAVLSRYEITGIKTHTMDIRTQSESQPAIRSIMEVDVNINGKELVLVVNHWKSKSGGETESEIWRDWQEFVLSNCANSRIGTGPEKAFLFTGDFNRSAEDFVTNFDVTEKNEYEKNVNGNTCFRGIEKIWANNPWFFEDGSFVCEIGSYYFEEKWERIDNFYSTGNLRITAFGPKTNGNWATGEGKPNAYKIFTGNGYSDHLPIMCTVIF